MPPRNRFESEYKANFKPHEVSPVITRKPQTQQDDHEVTPPKGLKKRDDLLKPPKPAMKKKENRALQYKAGLAPPMKTRDRLRYQSEYKKQFDWKKPLEQEAPILSAEKMIYGVHRDDHPVKASKVKMPKKSEYQLQFVKHPIISSPEARRELLDKHLIEWKEPSIPAGKPSSKPSQPSPPIPRKTMTFQSEYRANYKSPTKYQYAKGAWLGAQHPHIHHPDKVSDIENKEEPSSIQPWYQQVIELREKVRIYKARAREGSHFISLLKNLKENGLLDGLDDAGTPSKAPPGSPRPGGVGQPNAGYEAVADDGQEQPREKAATPSKTAARNPLQDEVVHDKEREADDKMKDQMQGPSKTKAPSPPLPTTKSKPSQTDHSDKFVKRPPEDPTAKKDRQGTKAPSPTLPTTKSQPSQTDHSDNFIKRPPEDPTAKTDRHLVYMKPASEDSDDGAGECLWNRELELPGPPLRKTHSIDTISHESTIASTTTLGSSSDLQRDSAPRREAWPEHKPAHVIPPYGISSSSATLIESDISLSEIRASSEDGISPPKDHQRPAVSNATRKLFTGRRRDPNDNKKVDFFSSDDERSVGSFSSRGSDVLSVEAMEKRRAMASETLQRARRRQAQM